jgi:predicted phage tail protein|tara:strand:- start:2047 stop:5358 length:3312 start_codon:yes stop_codon:yes gene_type:complete
MSIKEFDQNTTLSNPDLPSDALSSKQFITIVDVISEGEIAGFATPHKRGIASTDAAYKTACKTDIFLNKTPVLNVASGLTDAEFLAKVQNPDDTDFNFNNVGFDFRLGTASQSFIAGIKNIESENPIGTPVTASSPITHTVSSTNINAVRVTVRFGSLQKFEDDGDISGVEVQLRIKTIENNGTTTTVIDDTVKGRSTNAYFRDYLVNFSSTTSFPVQVRLERVTADSTDSTLVNAFSFHSATDIIFQQNAYPNTAHVALRLGAEQHPRVPNRVFRLRGIKVKIPHNATVDLATGRITYSGTFNGTFKTNKEWTTDPAWILYDVLSNDRYGCQIPESSLNKFTFKSVSEYCGQLVDDGKGGQEPRFSLNVNITQQQAAFDLVNDLCSVMRAIAFYNAGSISISQDSPKSPTFLFTNASVTEEGFTYTGSSLKTRHTVINVSYFDLETQDIDVETVEADAATQAKFGVVIRNINAFGTTSRGQAQRFGKWFLYNEQNTGETIAFTTTIDAGVTVRCGDIIEVSDSLKAGVRRGGRIKSVNGTLITLDDFENTDIPSLGSSPTLSVMLPDNTLETKNVINISNNVLTVNSAYSSNPNPNAVYILESSSLVTTTWRVLSVTENDDSTFNITALSHNSGKYNFVEDGTPLPVKSISTLTEIKQPPTGLRAEEKIVEINKRAVTKIMVDWQNVAGASKYRVYYRFNNGSFSQIETTASNLEILNTKEGDYEFKVYTYNALGEPSPTATTLLFKADGFSQPPESVSNLTLEPIDDTQVRLRWSQTTSIDVKFGGQVYIRHSPRTDGSGTFSNSTDLIQAISGIATEAVVPAKSGEYVLKFRDLKGNFSTTDASVILVTPTLKEQLALPQQRENPNFSGTKTNLTVAQNQLKLTDPAVNATGQYTFQNVLDLGAVFSLKIVSHILSVGANLSNLFDSIPDFDAEKNIDGGAVDNVNGNLFVRVTNDNPSSSPTFGTYNQVQSGTFRARAFDFKLEVESENANENILISELGFDAFLQARTEQSTTLIASGAGPKDVVFAAPFFTGTSAIGGSTSAYPPSIGITPQNMGSGEFFEITNITGSGFRITFKNSSNTAINRNFSYSAVGYGRGG